MWHGEEEMPNTHIQTKKFGWKEWEKRAGPALLGLVSMAVGALVKKKIKFSKKKWVQ